MKCTKLSIQGQLEICKCFSFLWNQELPSTVQLGLSQSCYKILQLWFTFAIQESWLHGSTKYPIHVCTSCGVGLDDLQRFLPKSMMLWFHEMEISQEPFNSPRKTCNDAFIFNLYFRPTGILCLESSEPGSVSENGCKLAQDSQDLHSVLSLHHSISWRSDFAFYLSREPNFLVYKGHMMQRRRHQPLTTIPYFGSFLLWPSCSTEVDLNKDLLTLYISVCIPFPSKE